MVSRWSRLGGLLLSFFGGVGIDSGVCASNVFSSFSEGQLAVCTSYFYELDPTRQVDLLTNMRSQVLRRCSEKMAVSSSREEKLRYIECLCHDRRRSELVSLFEDTSAYAGQEIRGKENIAKVANSVVALDYSKDASLAFAFLLSSGEEGIRVLGNSLTDLDSLCDRIYANFVKPLLSGASEHEIVDDGHSNLHNLLTCNFGVLIKYPEAQKAFEDYVVNEIWEDIDTVNKSLNIYVWAAVTSPGGCETFIQDSSFDELKPMIEDKEKNEIQLSVSIDLWNKLKQAIDGRLLKVVDMCVSNRQLYDLDALSSKIFSAKKFWSRDEAKASKICDAIKNLNKNLNTFVMAFSSYGIRQPALVARVNTLGSILG